MIALILKFWNDDAGFILTAEAIFLFTIAVLGIAVGMVALRTATVSELSEVANGIASVDQSYSFYGLGSSMTSVNGSGGVDAYNYVGFTTIVPPSQPINVSPLTGAP